MENKHTKKCGFELNHQDEFIFPPQESIPCCFSGVNEVGKHITTCTNLPTKKDEDNVKVRYFCEEHMIKVENIRRKMTQKYINEYKKKLINKINLQIQRLRKEKDNDTECECEEIKFGGRIEGLINARGIIKRDFDKENK